MEFAKLLKDSALGAVFPFEEGPLFSLKVISAVCISGAVFYTACFGDGNAKSGPGNHDTRSFLKKQQSDFSFAKKIEDKYGTDIKKTSGKKHENIKKTVPSIAEGSEDLSLVSGSDGRIKSLIAILKVSQDNASLAVKATDVLQELANSAAFGDNKDLIRKLGGLPSLISHLDICDQDVKIKSMWALSNLAIGQTNQYVLRDGFKKIVHLMELPFLDINASYFKGKGVDFQSPLELLEYIAAKNSYFYHNSVSFIVLLRNQNVFSKSNSCNLLEEEKQTIRTYMGKNDEVFFSRESLAAGSERQICDLRLIELATKCMLNISATEDHHKYIREQTEIFLKLFCLVSRELTRSCIKELFHSPFISQSVNPSDKELFEKVIERFDSSVQESILLAWGLYRDSTEDVKKGILSKVTPDQIIFARCMPDDLTVLSIKVLVNLSSNSMNVGQLTDNSVLFSCIITWTHVCLSRMRFMFKHLRKCNHSKNPNFKNECTNLYDIKTMLKNLFHLFRYLIIDNTLVFNIRTIISTNGQYILNRHMEMFIQDIEEICETCSDKNNFGDVDVITPDDVCEFNTAVKAIVKAFPDL